MEERLFDAVIFDLDGVITQTALVHSQAWKKMFDEYLTERSLRHKETFREFSHQDDYLPHVDGKPRYDGVRSFLASRNIELPYGDPADNPEEETICGIGNRKNVAFNNILEEEGVQVYPSTVELIHTLKDHGIHVGVASSSKNCKQVLEAAGLLDLIEVRVDGVVSAELGLNGKPAPDIFTTAADRLGVDYDRAVVVEDAVSGVAAGKSGNFGFVLGLAREDNEPELYIGGADKVVSDIADIGFEGIEQWFLEKLSYDNSNLIYYGYEPGLEKTRESLLTIGNGYMGTRGAWEESEPGKFHYPASYMAGLYNRLESKAGGKKVENEDFVNAINWVSFNFRIDGGAWFSPESMDIISIRRRLHMNKGFLCRKMIVRDKEGRKTLVHSRRFISMDNRHMMGIKYEITPMNYSGRIEIRSVLSGDHINDGVERYRTLNQQHLEPVSQGHDEGLQFLEVKTSRSGIHIAAAARLDVHLGKEVLEGHITEKTSTARCISLAGGHAETGQTLSVSKICSIYRSDDANGGEAMRNARNAVRDAGSFRDLLEASIAVWERIWQKVDIRIEGDRLAQKLIRLHIFHLIASISPHNADIDAGIPARGLHGEAYRGHIFWDEIYILPFYYMHFPEAAKSVLDYRYRRLPAAREYAAANGEQGAMFPWQSGSDGREETQVVHLNPVSGKWGVDHSSLQRHVSLAVAYNVIQYLHYTGDRTYFGHTLEMLVDICRFWAGKASKNEKTGRYSVEGVMGPDEFHEKYPDADEGGLTDNTYTNLMVVWVLEKTMHILGQGKHLMELPELTEEELDRWKDITEHMRLVISDDGILSQYDGYFDLEELDWDQYRNKYGNIYRMDRILKAEGKSPDTYKVAKQADTLMTYYNLDSQVVDGMIKKLGYALPEGYLKKNLNYYLQRTSHGSTLSRVVHARLAGMVGDQELSWKLYLDALTSDYNDIQGGTTAEGIHAGVMAGTVLGALQTFAGLDLQGDIVKINPRLPEHWRMISFKFTFKNVNYQCEISREKIMLLPDNDVVVEINGIRRDLLLGEAADMDCPQ